MVITDKSDKRLAHWYHKWNNQYFASELPVDTVLYWEPLTQDDGETCPVYEIDFGKFAIKIDPATMGFPRYWKMTLLHEMAHLKLWPKHPKHQHGKVFEQEMVRLAQAGAFKNLW